MNKIKIILVSIISILIIISIIILSLNTYVVKTTKKQIKTENELKEIVKKESVDFAIIFGAGVYGTTPSEMLKERLETGISLYKNKIVRKLLMSGDHGKKYYDEVTVMKNYAVEKGIPPENIYIDYAGFSTYDTVIRAKEIFTIKNAILVTQEYHLYRALYIGKSLGIKVYGISATKHKYIGQLYREIREILARNKDIFKCKLKMKSKYL